MGGDPSGGPDNGWRRRWDAWLLPRVDGQFTGTTDEIFQWAACKWGLPDNILRAIAVRESTWYQYLTHQDGSPYPDRGNGDYVDDEAWCTYISTFGYDYSNPCSATFGIAGVMSRDVWDDFPNENNGTFPFNRESTAFAVDYAASYLRGCYEGWVLWLGDHGSAYEKGHMWGCVGSWYSGDWHSAAANGYISRVRDELKNHTWLKRWFGEPQYS